MRLVLALAVFAVSATAAAAEAPRGGKSFNLAVVCKKTVARMSGLTSVCYYDCGGTEAAITVNAYDGCPRWMPRWRLKKSGKQFGPSEALR